MSYIHLKNIGYYENVYDRITVSLGRSRQEMFDDMYSKFFEIMPNEPHNSNRAVLHLNLFYSIMVGNDLLDRYDGREAAIKEMMSSDKDKDELVASARLRKEPTCKHCGKIGLRITDKLLHSKVSMTENENVLFMLNCLACGKNTACWEDGSYLEHRDTLCPKCKSAMSEKDVSSDKTITTTYRCLICGHNYKTKLDFSDTKEDVDPEYEADRAIYCLHDEKSRQELRDARLRHNEMAHIGKEWKEKEENKHIYDAIADINKINIPGLTTILSPVIEKEGYIEFSLDKPELGRDVVVGFSCLDSKSDRDDYESRKTLKKTVDRALQSTNWRLMSEGISYRLGYLNGRLKAYEGEDALKALVIKQKKQ